MMKERPQTWIYEYSDDVDLRLCFASELSAAADEAEANGNGRWHSAACPEARHHRSTLSASC
jgi:hypothetical protein